jgi:DNA repair photolyase
MIISASRRTDTPAFHATWFMDCIRREKVTVRNPFNPTQEKMVSLQPEDVDAIVFWTRNADPLIKHLPELDDRGYRYVFLYTITGYGSPLEKHSPAIDKATETFKTLSQMVGPQRVIWRFDPIIYVAEQGERQIISQFQQIANALVHTTSRVIISFLDFYKKVTKRLPALEQATGIHLVDIATNRRLVSGIANSLSAIASEHNMEIVSCAEKINLRAYGIRPGSCIDAQYLNEIFELNLSFSKDKGQRTRCRCSSSQDIGSYNTCRHGCVYCYAI